MEDHDIRVLILGMGREVAIFRCIPILVTATTDRHDLERTVERRPGGQARLPPSRRGGVKTERDRSRIVKGMTLYGDSYPGQIVTKSQEPPVRYGQQVPSSDEIQRRIAAAKRKIDFLRGKMKK